jgi:GTP cyclohydrolase II
MTNNPDKLAGLAAGVPWTTSRTGSMPAPHSADYLTVKKAKMGHLA